MNSPMLSLIQNQPLYLQEMNLNLSSELVKFYYLYVYKLFCWDFFSDYISTQYVLVSV